MTEIQHAPGDSSVIVADIEPEVMTVIASNLAQTIGPTYQGHEEFWRTLLLSVPEQRFLDLAFELYEERQTQKLDK